SWINFHAVPNAEYMDEPFDESLVEDGREVPFACGGSMLVSREVFLAAGGFDPDFFAYCEDVDLGWRLWVLGYKIRLAAKSRCFHRLHGTASSLPRHQRQLLYDRNTLSSLIKNVEDENLSPMLTVALFLLLERARLNSG